MTTHEARVGAVASALLAPPVITYWISSAMSQSGLDIFSVLLIEASAFAAAIMVLRPRASNAVLAGLLYFPSMSLLIIWIGHRLATTLWQGSDPNRPS